ncbi:MAG: IPT/TIG domain-containing protein [Patescibacteria group bacterium]
MKNKKTAIKASYKHYLLLMLVFSLITLPALADTVRTDFGLLLGDTSPLDLAVNIINWGLGILALIAVVIIIWGGATWLLSGGNEEKVEKAKKIIINGVIGLLIILASWGIATYLVNKLVDMTNPDQGTGPGGGYSTRGSIDYFYIDHSNPANGDTDVSLCHLIAVTFNLPVKQETITNDSYKVTLNSGLKKGDGENCSSDTDCLSANCESSGCVGDQVAGTFGFSSEDESYVAVWYPQEDYLPSSVYRVELTTAIYGLDETTIDEYSLSASDSKRIFRFATGTITDNIPPKVNIVAPAPYPADEETEVCRRTPIQVSFSESLDPTTVNHNNLRLYAYTDSVDPNALGDGENLDINRVRYTSIGGSADDTFITTPVSALAAYSVYGLSLYSGAYDATATSVRTNYLGAVRDTCGNPLSGDFDDEMEGSPTDDFIESSSAGGADWDYQWKFTTGNVENCTPTIRSISYNYPAYYSEDNDPYGQAGSEDSDLVEINGDYLYPFYDADFYYNLSAAGMNCFDQQYTPLTSCFVGNSGAQQVTLRVPVGSRSGRVSIENENGQDSSDDRVQIVSPYIRSLSPSQGPAEQFVTLKGENFGDYNPAITGSTKGVVYFGYYDDAGVFNRITAETPCADGWDNDEIIVKVPSDFDVADFPLIQIQTVSSKYSNQRGFTITDGQAGPGICTLDPDCSDTGVDDVNIIGQSFGSTMGKVYFANSDDTSEADINDWDVTYSGDLTIYGGYDSVLTDSTPVSAQDDYEITAASKDDAGDNVYSNSLDFNIPCQQAPRLFGAYDCNIDNDLIYLPNPHPYEDQACVNSTVVVAFDSDMNDSSVADGVDIYNCGSGDASGNYLAESCGSEITGSWSSEMLSQAYLGGSPDFASGYESFSFTPSSDLIPNTWYLVSVTQNVTNTYGITLAEAGLWHFKIRNDATVCSVDSVRLRPVEQTQTRYNPAQPYPINYTVTNDDTSRDYYSYKASAYNSDCFALSNETNWHWIIDNYDADNIVKFSDGNTTMDTTSGYNKVYMQGDGSENFGTAYVSAGVSADPYPEAVEAEGEITYADSWVHDTSLFEVDFGYCTSDADCQITGCETSTCDLTSSHCTPVINAVSPEPVGRGGCVALSGCYFGPSRLGSGTCTCTETDGSRTCLVSEGHTTCLLSSTVGCSLEADCDSSNSTYSFSGHGSVSFSDSEGVYLNENLCQDTWSNNEIIVEVPTALSAGNYDINLVSYYGLPVTHENISVQNDPTPCLCLAEPDNGQEGDAINIYGTHFDVLNTATDSSGNDQRWAEFYNGRTSTGIWTDLSATDSDTYGSDAWKLETHVAPNALTSATNGLRLSDINGLVSNYTNFSINCRYNSDCQSGCCEDHLCQMAEQCNDCENKTDCSYDSCQSDCIAGMCQPYISSISPNYGNVGQPITVRGCHFGSFYQNGGVSSPYYSRVTLNDVEAEFACSEDETWNNEEIKIIAPDNIFTSSMDSAEVNVSQVYFDSNDSSYKEQQSVVGQAYCKNSSDSCSNESTCTGACQSVWYSTVFNLSNECDGVDVPVLCNLDGSNGTYGDEVDLSGYNFYGSTDVGAENTESFCTCDGDYDDSCNIDVDSSSCDINHTYTCYADPENVSEICSSTLSTNQGYNYYFTSGCSEAIYTSQSNCEDNSGTWTDINKCRCINPDEETQYCWIENGATSCSWSQSETCYVDGYDSADTDPAVCNEDSRNYTALYGNITFTNNHNGEYNYISSAALLSYVPELAETGNVYVKAVKEDGTVCGSNGANYDITCDTCSDCSDDLMCDLSTGEGEYGLCTSSTAGFCANYPDSCCGNTGCRESVVATCELDAECVPSDGASVCPCYPDNSLDSCDVVDGATSCEIVDGGVCYDRPLLDEASCVPTNNEIGICTNAQLSIVFNSNITTSDAYNSDDSDFEVNYEDYIKLIKYADYDGSFNDAESLLSSVSLSQDQTLVLQQNTILDPLAEYAVLIYSYNNTGIIDSDNYVSLGCSDAQVAAGICSNDGSIWIMRFTTNDEAGGCPPSYIDVEASNQEFINSAYTFISKEEEQNFLANVYSDGEDEIRRSSDDQAIISIDGVLGWDYHWDPLFDSLEDLEADACPTVGIIKGIDLGTCTCNLGETECTADEETCTMNENDTYCLGDTYNEACYYDITTCSESAGCGCELKGETCTVDDGEDNCETATYGTCYYSNACDSGTCDCTLEEEACTINSGETECALDDRNIDLNETNATCVSQDAADSDYECEVDFGSDSVACDTDSGITCTLDSACDQNNENYNEGEFLEDQAIQTATAGYTAGTGWITATIEGDLANPDHNWSGEITDSQFVRVVYCDSRDFLSAYDDNSYISSAHSGWSGYNFSFAYCRGSSADNLLPDYGDTDYIVAENGTGNDEYLRYDLFKNSDNEDLFAIQVFANSLDDNSATIYDAVHPGLWGELRLENFSNYSDTTLDGYKSAEGTYNTLVSVANLSGSTLYPNIYLLSVNKEADATTLEALRRIKDSLVFNINSEFAPVGDGACQAIKEQLVRDTQRITDIGSLNYLLARHYYLDLDQDTNNNYPSVAEGSYIRHYTNSTWPSWNSVLSNALGQSIATDPYNSFWNEAEECYDESGTCWDPIENDFYCPTGSNDDEESYTYQYIGNSDGSNYDIYANLELNGTDYPWSWSNYSGNPCSSVSQYSSQGCTCFNYQMQSSAMTNFYYGTCDTVSSNTCSDSGFNTGTGCTSDADCQIVQ